MILKTGRPGISGAGRRRAAGGQSGRFPLRRRGYWRCGRAPRRPGGRRRDGERSRPGVATAVHGNGIHLGTADAAGADVPGRPGPPGRWATAGSPGLSESGPLPQRLRARQCSAVSCWERIRPRSSPLGPRCREYPPPSAAKGWGAVISSADTAWVGCTSRSASGSAPPPQRTLRSARSPARPADVP